MGRSTGFWGRLLAATLDVRPRPLLHPARWILLGVVAAFGASVVQYGLGPSHSGQKSLGYILYWDGARHSLRMPPGRHPNQLTQDSMGSADFVLGHRKHQSRWTATVEVRVTPAAAAGPVSDDELSEIAADIAREFSATRMGDAEGQEPWIREAWRELLESGQTAAAVTRPAPLENLMLYWGAEVVRWTVLLVAAMSVVLWFVRGVQLAAYERMLSQHQSGRCPKCGYDISAAPDHDCPECGADHRALRREAIGALRRGERRSGLAHGAPD
jgi:hypothetical protein